VWGWCGGWGGGGGGGGGGCTEISSSRTFAHKVFVFLNANTKTCIFNGILISYLQKYYIREPFETAPVCTSYMPVFNGGGERKVHLEPD